MESYNIVELLEAALASANLELAEFGRIFPDGNLVPYPTNEKEVTAFIKDRVRLHHDTWIIKPIKTALEKIRG